VARGDGEFVACNAAMQQCRGMIVSLHSSEDCIHIVDLVDYTAVTIRVFGVKNCSATALIITP
jgi:hypothetical protein